METTRVVKEATSPSIPAEDRDAARRYIAAIVARDRRASADSAFAALRRRQLWEQFEAEYGAAQTGPYARHGRAALRIALSRL